VNVTLSIEDEVIQRARAKAEAMGTSVNQLIRDYLRQFGR
jgi:predicted HicB family RNase H-like nuclease